MSQDVFFPRVETERLILKPLLPSDAPGLLAIFSDAEVMRYWNTAPWADVQEAIAFIEQSNESMRVQQSLVLGIWLRSTGELAGKCMLFSYDKASRRAEIGFGLARSCWGQGYISEAGDALVQYGFEVLGLRRIEAEIDPANQASAKALEKLGFAHEGLLRQRWEVNGVVSDSAIYGRLLSDHPTRHV
ncbi:GNAT family N-acetyltransferase [Pseudomonas sp. NCHU5208]|uniref:GNAT family N-acetyltransferase n=1 Tax=unclassified Pseudomonas TaxID=196821 RepID=UPI003F9BD802